MKAWCSGCDLVGVLVLERVEEQQLGDAVAAVDDRARLDVGRHADVQRADGRDRGQGAHALDQGVAIGNRIGVLEPEEDVVGDLGTEAAWAFVGHSIAHPSDEVRPIAVAGHMSKMR